MRRASASRSYYAREGFNTVQIEVERGAESRRRHRRRRRSRCSKARSRSFARSRREGATRTRDGRDPPRAAAAHRRAGEPRRLVAGAQAAVRHQRVPPGRHRAGADRADDRGVGGRHPAGARRGPRRRVSGVAAALRRCSSTTNDERRARSPTATRASRTSASWPTCRTRICSAARSPPASPARYERDRQAGSLFTSNGSFFGLPIRSSGFIFTSRQRFARPETSTTIDQRVGLSAEQRWRPFRYVGGDLELPLRAHHTFDPEPARGDPVPLDVVNVSTLNAGVVLDRRDDPSEPTRGWFTSANWEQARRARSAPTTATASCSCSSRCIAGCRRGWSSPAARSSAPASASEALICLRALPARRRDDGARLRGERARAARCLRASRRRRRAAGPQRRDALPGARLGAGRRRSSMPATSSRRRGDLSFSDLARRLRRRPAAGVAVRDAARRLRHSRHDALARSPRRISSRAGGGTSGSGTSSRCRNVVSGSPGRGRDSVTVTSRPATKLRGRTSQMPLAVRSGAEARGRSRGAPTSSGSVGPLVGDAGVVVGVRQIGLELDARPNASAARWKFFLPDGDQRRPGNARTDCRRWRRPRGSAASIAPSASPASSAAPDSPIAFHVSSPLRAGGAYASPARRRCFILMNACAAR